MFKTVLIIGAGGAIGSIFRYLTSLFVAKFWSGHFPLATFITNAIGCLLIGLFIGFLERQQLANSDLKWFLLTGFCGGYTTFSTFGHENFMLLQNHNSMISFAYIGLSILTGLAAIWFGLFVSKM